NASTVDLVRISEKELDFNRDKYIQIPITSPFSGTQMAKSAMGNVLGTIGQVGIQKILNPNGIFSATVNPGMLTKFANGSTSTMIHGTKGIVGHAGFTSANVSVFA